jgi:DNA-binding NarL/FixJ family response regulator
MITNILIVDPFPLYRLGFSTLIRRIDGETKVFETSNIDEAISIAQSNPALNLIIIDFPLPSRFGISQLLRLTRNLPTIPLVVTIDFADSEISKEVMEAGAMGFIPKTYSEESVLSALRKVLAGGTYFPTNQQKNNSPNDGIARSYVVRSLIDRRLKKSISNCLTERQTQLLKPLCDDLSNKQIAVLLGISENTVKTHLSNIYNELKVGSRIEAIKEARRLGLGN